MIRLSFGGVVAGAVIKFDIVVRCAPVIGFMKGWQRERVIRYARQRRWKVEEL